jgi:hypothetical protein
MASFQIRIQHSVPYCRQHIKDGTVTCQAVGCEQVKCFALQDLKMNQST